MPPRKRASSGFDLPRSIGTAIIGLLVSLIGTGIVSMISLYTRQAALTEQVGQTSSALAKHLDHAVDRDEYLRRDAEIQRAIEKMATKEELQDLKHGIDAQNDLLRQMEESLTRRGR